MVTLLVQVVLTWLLVGQIVWTDMHNGKLAPPLSPSALSCCRCNRGVPPYDHAAYEESHKAALAGGPRQRRRARLGGCCSWLTTQEDLFRPYPPTVIPMAPVGAGAAAPASTGASPELPASAPLQGGTTAVPAAVPIAETWPVTRPAVANRCSLWTRNVGRMAAWLVLCFIPFWGLGVGICAAIWGNTNCESGAVVVSVTLSRI